MYDFDVTSSAENLAASVRAMDLIDKHAPPRHTARAATGSLAKLLSWNEEQPLKSGEVLCHQADYVAMNLMSDAKKCGSGGGAMKRIVRSDWHNTLKCGYDVLQKVAPLFCDRHVRVALRRASTPGVHGHSPGLPQGHGRARGLHGAAKPEPAKGS